MQAEEYIDLFFSKSYEKDIDKLIRDDRDYVIPFEKLQNYVNNIISIPYIEFVNYICSHPLKDNIETKDVTQSSSFAACEIEMCNALLSVDNPGLNYLEIGQLFPQYVAHPNDAALRKYGENQIKTSAHLGLVYEYYKYWYLSCLGYIYPRLSEDERAKLLARTIIRTPLYYRMMVDLCNKNIEATRYMSALSRATQLRREGSVCRLIDICLNECRMEGIRMHKLIRSDDSETHKPVIYDLFHTISTKAAEPQPDNEMVEDNGEIHEEEEDLEEDDDTDLLESSLPTEPLKIDDFNIEGNCILRIYFAEISQYQVFSVEQTLSLLKRYRKGNKKALDLLVKSNLRIIVPIARSFMNRGVPLEDLIQEGTIGLITAIKRFNPYYNRDFLPYVKMGIYRSIKQVFNDIQCAVVIPSSHICYHRLIRKFCDNYVQREEMEPPFEFVEIKEEMSPGYLKPIYNLPPDLHNIMVQKNDWDDVEDPSCLADKQLILDSEIYDLRRLVNALPVKMSTFVIEYYGLDGSPEQTLGAIAEKHNLTRERARQIIESAKRNLKKLAHAVMAKEDRTLIVHSGVLSRMHGNQFNAFNSNIEIKLKGNVQLGSRVITERSQSKPIRIISQDELKTLIHRVMKTNWYAMTAKSIASQIRQYTPNEIVPQERIEDLLTKMTDVGRLTDGSFFLKDLYHPLQVNRQETKPKLQVTQKGEEEQTNVIVVESRKIGRLKLEKSIRRALNEFNAPATPNEIAIVVRTYLPSDVLFTSSEVESLLFSMKDVEILQGRRYVLRKKNGAVPQPTSSFPSGTENESELKSRILQVMQLNPHPMTNFEISTKVNARPELVAHVLRGMLNVVFIKGTYELRGARKKEPQKRQEEKRLASAQPIGSKGKATSQDAPSPFRLSTPLHQLVELKILTKKECKHCHHKGLRTIGDVKGMIEKHSLTRESSRFTQFTLDIWFKIVDLLKKEKSEERTVEKKKSYQGVFADDLIFEKYCRQIMNIRQSKINGKVNIAKPVLLLAFIEGIDEGVFSNNRFLLNDWLEKRYEILTRLYSSDSVSGAITGIDKPFWHLQNDGFWHLHYLVKQQPMTNTPSSRWLKDYVQFGYFDHDLWVLLQHYAMRHRLRDYVIEHKLSDDHDS